MNCDYCGSGIHSSDDMYISREVNEEDENYYHKWCWENVAEEHCKGE